ncbi:hypothetical protein LPJ66_007678 [Kickxella alabastrina]|uniref:Uncharacterized protein n=1 Tax=Kickxella alabastrina TaxID=61397 RepID=A0ACC1I8S9_9FUNG|nr:hypothetical protein LPJ66_007678 [Kickxella alabastrina]
MSDEGASPEEQLLSACMMDQPHLVKELLRGQQPVNVNFKNGLGFTALHYAAQQGSVECVKALVGARGLQPNIQDNLEGDTPLHKALTHCDSSETALEIAKLLVSAGADPRIVNREKQRPVNLTEPEEEDIRRLLLQATLALQIRHDKVEGTEDGDYSSD